MNYQTIRFILIAITILLLSSCAAINQAPYKQSNWNAQVIDPAKHDYTILGPVRVEKKFTGILGNSQPMFLGYNKGIFIIQFGGINYIDVLENAQSRYPTTDSVIDITYDYNLNLSVLGLFTSRKDIVTGMAVRYAREQNNTQNRNVQN